MAWFGIRTIYLFGAKPGGINVFEERIVCFEAASAEEAQEKAYEERQAYASENGFVAFSEQEGYEQDGDQLIDGCEVWSALFESTQSLEEFYQGRYAHYRYLGPQDDDA